MKSSVRGSLDVGREVLKIEAEALLRVAEALDARFSDAVALLVGCRGRVVCCGMGKAGLVLKKVAATLSSTGTPAFFLHPGEGMHGDLGMVVAGDVLLVGSASGETREVVVLAELVRARGIKVLVLTGNPESSLGRLGDCVVPIPVEKEACPLNLAPTASSTALLAVGDALAVALMEERGFTALDFRQFHPGGLLGASLRAVSEVMASGARCPLIGVGAGVVEAVGVLNGGGLGIVGVVDESGRLVGCLSDGDVRRLVVAGRLGAPLSEVMSVSPKFVAPYVLVRDARELMHRHKITCIFVVDAGKVVGVVSVHV